MKLSLKRSVAAPPARRLPDLLVFSHLRWDFVFQRPQQLMKRFARHRRVIFFEAPTFGSNHAAFLRLVPRAPNVRVAVPHLPHGLTPAEVQDALIRIVDIVVREEGLTDFALWYFTPTALPISAHLKPASIIYDCMDDSAGSEVPWPGDCERRLLARADLVFTGSQSLHTAKRGAHPNMHCIPSSVDQPHFAQARSPSVESPDDQPLAGPRIGYFGVIDERFDLALVDRVAELRPSWQLVIVGPVTIDPATLPRRGNIHYLGMRRYDELPAYIAGWSAALLPFVRSTTCLISPPQTVEYLAAGCPVVSTPIPDVAESHGRLGLVQIAEEPDAFVAAVERAMAQSRDPQWLASVDAFLAGMSWDSTCDRMADLEAASARRPFAAAGRGITDESNAPSIRA